jgi:hypothetical protein
LAGRREEAVAKLQSAKSSPPLAPFARYALAALGEDDLAAVLSAQPGWFLAVRCRARLALDRFRRREAAPAEVLEALQQAEGAGYRPNEADHFRRLALALKQRNPHADDLRRLADAADGDGAGRNLIRAAVEVASHLLPPREALDLLREWSPRAAQDPALRAAAGRQILRLLLLAGPDAAASSVLASAEALLGDDPMLALVRAWVTGTDVPPLPPPGADAPPLVRLWEAAVALREGPADRDRWRADVAAMRTHPRLRGVAQALLVQEAAACGDAGTVAALIEDGAAWQGFPGGPPRFVVRAVKAVLGGQPRWRPALARWLQTWDADALGAEGRPLAVQAGLVRLEAATAEAPPEAPAVAWLLHQAAGALARDDAREALAWVRRALASDPDLKGAGEKSDLVRAALPELECLARAQLLAKVVRLDPAQPPVDPRALADLLDALQADPAGQAVLDAAGHSDLAAAREALGALADRDDLPPRLAHHLAVVHTRAASSLEGQGRVADAEPCWRRAWRCWLRVLPAPPPDDHPLVCHLLDGHRRRVAQLLGRGEVEAARKHWNLVQSLPGVAPSLGARVARFREELATDHLVATREAMRYGDIPEGYTADYDKGLAGLTRLLSLDRDNVRLLTALVETCNAWFHECYNNEDARRLWEGVERFTPFALKLAGRGDRRGDLPARAALADFYKFRGFVAPERDRKVALYREALAFDPANANVRLLLEEAEAPEVTQ